MADPLHPDDTGIHFEELNDAEGNNAGTCVKMKIPVKMYD